MEPSVDITELYAAHRLSLVRLAVLLVDDVLATGGTAEAAGGLIRQLGATVVGFSFLMALGFLGGRERLAGVRHTAVLAF